MNIYGSHSYREDLQAAISGVRDLEKLHHCAVLISGASGLIGSFLVDMLLRCNEDGADITIYALGRSLKRLQERFAYATDHLHLIEQDVCQPPTFDFPVDYVIHAASNAYPAAFASDPVGTILGNISGTEHLLRYAHEHGAKRLAYVSSGEVYGQGDPLLTAFREDYSGYVDPTQARSCYPAAKRAAETLCVSYTKQYGLDTVIVRPCHTYGPNATKSDNRANAQFVSNAMAGENIVLRSKGTQMRSYCYIADCASALLTALLHGESCQAYNLANPDARVTIGEFAACVAREAGVEVQFAQDVADDQKTPITYAVLDSHKLCALGWSGQYSVEKGIAHTIKTLSELQK